MPPAVRGPKGSRPTEMSRRNRRSPTLGVQRCYQETTVATRERIDQGTSKRFVRRDERGRFTSDQTSVGRSLAADRRQHAKKVVAKGQGDRGDQRRSSKG
jgi:hypothetical protein